MGQAVIHRKRLFHSLYCKIDSSPYFAFALHLSHRFFPFPPICPFHIHFSHTRLLFMFLNIHGNPSTQGRIWGQEGPQELPRHPQGVFHSRRTLPGPAAGLEAAKVKCLRWWLWNHFTEIWGFFFPHHHFYTHSEEKMWRDLPNSEGGSGVWVYLSQVTTAEVWFIAG